MKKLLVLLLIVLSFGCSPEDKQERTSNQDGEYFLRAQFLDKDILQTRDDVSAIYTHCSLLEEYSDEELINNGINPDLNEGTVVSINIGEIETTDYFIYAYGFYHENEDDFNSWLTYYYQNAYIVVGYEFSYCAIGGMHDVRFEINGEYLELLINPHSEGVNYFGPLTIELVNENSAEIEYAVSGSYENINYYRQSTDEIITLDVQFRYPIYIQK